MASLGLPGMSGFVSEFLAFLGLFQGEPVIAAVGVIGIILTAVYVLRATLQVTFGKKEWEAKLIYTDGSMSLFYYLSFVLLQLELCQKY